MRAPKQLKKKNTETHPQSGPVKRLSLAGAKPLKLTTLTTLSAVFLKAQSSQSEAKKEASSNFEQHGCFDTENDICDLFETLQLLLLAIVLVSACRQLPRYGSAPEQIQRTPHVVDTMPPLFALACVLRL